MGGGHTVDVVGGGFVPDEDHPAPLFGQFHGAVGVEDAATERSTG